MEQKGEVMHPSMESGVRLFLVGIVMWVAGFAVGEIPRDRHYLEVCRC